MAKRKKNKKNNRVPTSEGDSGVLSEEGRFFLFQDAVTGLKVLVILCLVSFFFYLQSLDNPIVFDTAQSFNHEVLNKYYDDFNIMGSRHISLLTFGAMFKIVQDNWFWHRLLNVVFHATNGFFIFYFLNLIFGHFISDDEKNRIPIHSSWVAFFGALAFILNPLSVYGTAYLVQRTGQMMVLFSMITLICYFKGMTKDDWRWYLGSVVGYFFAIHSKELSIMLPVVVGVMILVVELPRYTFLQLVKRHWWPFVLFTVIALETVYQYKTKLGEVYEPHGEQMIRSANIRETVLTEDSAYILSVITQMIMYFRYLYLWFIPDVRHIFIDIHLPFATSYLAWPDTLFVVGFITYPVLCAWLMIKGGVKRILGFTLISPWILFMTELSLVRLSEQFVIYRAYFWMTLVIGGALPFLLAIKIKGRTFPRSKIGLVVLYLMALCLGAQDRMNTFNSKTDLWRDVVNKVKDQDKKALYKAYRPYNNLAFALTSSGKLEESIPYYYQALQINPKYVKARSNLGAVLTNRGRFQEAIEHFKKAIALDPLYVDAHVGLGVCAAEQGFNEEAIEHYRNALKAKPDYPDALFNMGNAYLKLKQYETAIKFYSKAIVKKPNFADSHHNLGIAYSNIGKIREAQKAFESAIKIDPSHKKSNEALQIIRNRVFGNQQGRSK